MGIFTRLTDIVQANVNAALDRAEDPEKLVRLMVQEMEQALVELRTTSASLIAEKKVLQRKRDKQQASIDFWQSQAEKAVANERDDLAKSALMEKQKAEKTVSDLQPELSRIDEVLAKVNQDNYALQNKLQQAKVKLNEYQLRVNSAEARVKVKTHLHCQQIDDALTRFEEIEQKVERIEAQVESYEIGQSAGLKEQFEALEKQDLVEDELTKLKQQLAAKAA